MSFRHAKGNKLVSIDNDQYTNRAGSRNDEEWPSARLAAAFMRSWPSRCDSHHANSPYSERASANGDKMQEGRGRHSWFIDKPHESFQDETVRLRFMTLAERRVSYVGCCGRLSV
jgi:hypothetical protein